MDQNTGSKESELPNPKKQIPKRIKTYEHDKKTEKASYESFDWYEAFLLAMRDDGEETESTVQVRLALFPYSL